MVLVREPRQALCLVGLERGLPLNVTLPNLVIFDGLRGPGMPIVSLTFKYDSNPSPFDLKLVELHATAPEKRYGVTCVLTDKTRERFEKVRESWTTYGLANRAAQLHADIAVKDGARKISREVRIDVAAPRDKIPEPATPKGPSDKANGVKASQVALPHVVIAPGPQPPLPVVTVPSLIAEAARLQSSGPAQSVPLQVAVLTPTAQAAPSPAPIGPAPVQADVAPTPKRKEPPTAAPETRSTRARLERLTNTAPTFVLLNEVRKLLEPEVVRMNERTAHTHHILEQMKTRLIGGQLSPLEVVSYVNRFNVAVRTLGTDGAFVLEKPSPPGPEPSSSDGTDASHVGDVLDVILRGRPREPGAETFMSRIQGLAGDVLEKLMTPEKEQPSKAADASEPRMA